MRMTKKLILPLMAIQLLSTYAFAGEIRGMDVAAVNNSAISATPHGASFDVKADLVVTVLRTNQGQFSHLVGKKLKIGAGSDITVLEALQDEKGNALVHVGVNNDQDADGISDMWVNAEELNSSALEMENDADFGAEIQQDEMPATSFSARRVVTKKKKMTYCYRFVKQYLMKTGQVPVYLSGGSAWMAAAQLPKYGFKKLAIKPTQAKVGDVCVYHGGNGNNGHIEVLTAKGWYYGYGYINHPIANHPFIGCFRK